MSQELYVIEAMTSEVRRSRLDNRRLEQTPQVTAVEWRFNPERMMLGRTQIIGPFDDYHAAHRWLHWHHNVYAAMVIHRMTPPEDDAAIVAAERHSD